jgi:hypothetical protein
VGYAIRSFLDPIAGAFEAICLGVVGVRIFRLGFYRDDERRCIVGGIAIFLRLLSLL